MELNLRLVSSHNIPYKVEHKPRMLEAREMGRYYLESKLGVPLTFNCYQPAVAKMEEHHVPDDAYVEPGAVISYGVSMEPLVHKHTRQTALLKKLATPVLMSTMALYASKFHQHIMETNQQGGLEDALASSPQIEGSFTAALVASGSSMSSMELAKELDKICKATPAPSGDKPALLASLKELYEAGVGDLLASELPGSCHILRNYDIFLQLVPQH